MKRTDGCNDSMNSREKETLHKNGGTVARVTTYNLSANPENAGVKGVSKYGDNRSKQAEWPRRKGTGQACAWKRMKTLTLPADTATTTVQGTC